MRSLFLAATMAASPLTVDAATINLSYNADALVFQTAVGAPLIPGIQNGDNYVIGFQLDSDFVPTSTTAFGVDANFLGTTDVTVSDTNGSMIALLGEFNAFSLPNDGAFVLDMISGIGIKRNGTGSLLALDPDIDTSLTSVTDTVEAVSFDSDNPTTITPFVFSEPSNGASFSSDDTAFTNDLPAVPLPASLTLLLGGLGALYGAATIRRRSRQPA
jgi:hypothetical protein